MRRHHNFKITKLLREPSWKPLISLMFQFFYIWGYRILQLWFSPCPRWVAQWRGPKAGYGIPEKYLLRNMHLINLASCKCNYSKSLCGLHFWFSRASITRRRELYIWTLLGRMGFTGKELMSWFSSHHIGGLMTTENRNHDISLFNLLSQKF